VVRVARCRSSWGYSVDDHLAAVVDALGGDHLDYVLQSNSALAPDAIEAYASLGQRPVGCAPETRLRAITRAQIRSVDIADHHELVRHDASKLAVELLQLVSGRGNEP
jgi:hypothetical protein